VPPSSLRNLAPPSPPPTSAPLAAPLDDEAETTAPPTVQPSERKRDSFAPAAMLAATAAAQNHYVPPAAPPKPARPLSALETIPASRYHHSLAPQVLSQSVPPPAPQKRGFGLLFAAAAALGLAAVAGFFALGGAKTLGLSGGTGSLAVTAAGPGSAALDGVRVLVDGAVVCEKSPCELGDLKTGTHFVTVEANGYTKTAARAVSIEKNGTAALDVELVPEQAAKPAEAKLEAAPATATPEPEAKVVTTEAPTAPRSAPVAKTARVEKKVASTSKKETAKSDKAEKKPEAAAQPAAMGTLNINSIPVANVVLDGRPMGSTPLVGLSVSPGPHSVVFVHPEKGRKAAGTTVHAGGTSTVAVRF
jgi:hypothetical protein